MVVLDVFLYIVAFDIIRRFRLINRHLDGLLRSFNRNRSILYQSRLIYIEKDQFYIKKDRFILKKINFISKSDRNRDRRFGLVVGF